MEEIGGDFSQREQDESTLMHSGMGELEAGSVQNQVAVDEQVKVEGAGAVGDAVGTVASEGQLDFKEMPKEGSRAKRGLEGRGGVEEGGLICVAHRLGCVIRGLGYYCAELAEGLESCIESSVWRPGGAEDVGSEGDVGCGHGRVASLGSR